MAKQEPGGVLVVTNAAVAKFGEAMWKPCGIFPLSYHVTFYLDDAVHSFGLIKNSTQHHTSEVLFLCHGTSGIGDSNAPPPPPQHQQY